MGNKLAQFFGLSDKPKPGLIDQAKQTLSGRDYQLHVQEAKAMGEPPMTPEQFAASRK